MYVCELCSITDFKSSSEVKFACLANVTLCYLYLGANLGCITTRHGQDITVALCRDAFDSPAERMSHAQSLKRLFHLFMSHLLSPGHLHHRTRLHRGE